jgi:hypothetical protein
MRRGGGGGGGGEENSRCCGLLVKSIVHSMVVTMRPLAWPCRTRTADESLDRPCR